MILLQHGDWTATINPVGAGLATLSKGDRAVIVAQDETGELPHFRGSVLVPWVNRLADGTYTFDGISYTVPINEPERQTALHGLGLEKTWDIDEQTASSVTVSTACGPVDGYPFAVIVAVTYALRDAGLAVRLDAYNGDEVTAPFAAGFHPYLLGGVPIDEAELRIAARRRLITSPDRLLPVELSDTADGPYDFSTARVLGDIVLDDALTELTDGVIDFADLQLTLSPELGWVQVFTPLDRQSLAIEPCTSGPDAFNSDYGLVVLAPGESFACAWSLSIRR
ncbi:aldose 1-epimerase family protein [soil metagenome]